MNQARFCLHCGARLSVQLPPGDHMQRPLCMRCGYVHYHNPKMLVAVFITHGPRLLWLRRGTEPRRGYWGHPTGFIEAGESPAQAAARELCEETCLKINPKQLELYAVASLVMLDQVYLVFRGELDQLDYAPTVEAPQIEMLSEQNAPWQSQAYKETEPLVRRFYQEHRTRKYGIYYGDA